MHPTRGILVRVAIVIAVPASWWISTAMAWRHLFNTTYPPFNLQDFLTLEGADQEGIGASLYVGFFAALVLFLLAWTLKWVLFGKLGIGEKAVEESGTVYTRIHCHDPQCRCARHGSEYFDAVKNMWVAACRDPWCHCGYHEGEHYDPQTGEWVDDEPSDEEIVNSLISPVN